MTSFLAVEFETIGLKDFDEFLESAFQAWHWAANPIGPSCPARLKTVERNNRNAHINLTKNGALRFSNCDRVGSGASMARSTYISMATPRDWHTSSNEWPCTARSRSRQIASHLSPRPAAMHCRLSRIVNHLMPPHECWCSKCKSFSSPLQ